MDYDGVINTVCDAEENDWLDVSYSERKYVGNKTAEKKTTKHKGKKIGVTFAVLGIIFACVAVFGIVLYADNDFRTDVFTSAKTAYIKVAEALEGKSNKTGKTLEIPCNVNLVEVTNGVATFDGGRTALAFADGKVTEVTDTSVTVQIDEQTSIMYTELTTVYVVLGQNVSSNELIGKYDGSFCASISDNGQTVKDVVASEDFIVWNV